MSDEITTRQQILTQARRLFATAGFDGTSVRDIVSAAGVNVSLVSYYFGGKEGLYRECIKQAGTMRLDLVQETLKPASTAGEFAAHLKAYVSRALELLAADLESPKIIATELDRGNDIFLDLLREVFLKVHEHLAAYFAAGQARGFVRAGLEPRLLASMLQGLINNEARLDVVKVRVFGISLADAAHRAECERHILTLVLDGITP